MPVLPAATRVQEGWAYRSTSETDAITPGRLELLDLTVLCCYNRLVRAFVPQLLLALSLWVSPAAAAQTSGTKIGLRAALDDLVRQMTQRGESKGEIHLAVAALHAAAGDQSGTLKHLRAARKLGIAAGRANLVLADYYRRSRRYDAALATLVRILVDNPEQPHALVQLWKTLYAVQLQGVAVKADLGAIRDRLLAFGMRFPKSLRLDVRAAQEGAKLTAAGYNALLAQQNTFAAQLFEAAIDAAPSNARAHRGLGIARARAQDYRRAAGAYLLYLELNPNAPDGAKVDRALMDYWRQHYRD